MMIIGNPRREKKKEVNYMNDEKMNEHDLKHLKFMLECHNRDNQTGNIKDLL